MEFMGPTHEGMHLQGHAKLDTMMKKSKEIDRLQSISMVTD